MLPQNPSGSSSINTSNAGSPQTFSNDVKAALDKTNTDFPIQIEGLLPFQGTSSSTTNKKELSSGDVDELSEATEFDEIESALTKKNNVKSYHHSKGSFGT
ncbi:hypothetical protein FDP41_011156 [Naegleria fowleri]|uniref:Uncharacterized protein n=1 Tax=Naegleria fowleri TaxID=5763 RepID=A0A6A5CCB7_NAEFO|nr:uncharacterized protein FDP41_011156 [Naegleria fowleri]KAF0983178.1 hypothetical protein FDP41_011156 [Naegleria fowleri]